MDSHGHDEPDFRYNIKIVVYEGIAAEEVQKLYPTKINLVDYRYVPRRQAEDFLSKSAALPEMTEDAAKTLRRTLAKIQAHFKAGR